jgi:TolB-like protein
MRLETGQYFYAMELIEGETLQERVRRAGPLDARTTIGIAQQVTSALAAAEKHGLVHRDLKPANLMLINADDAEVKGSDQARSKRSKIRALRKSGIPVVKIIDFGLAKAFHTATDRKSLTHDRFVGTPAFASPEQFEHSALDVRSDIYSLGETLWFALTGKTPFAGHALSEIHRAQKSNALPIEQLKAAHVPSRLRSLLESMLALEPASRPGTGELAARLKRCSPEARSVRRTRVTLAAAALLIVGACTAIFFLWVRTQNSISNPGAPGKSIAVLPFENRSEDKANAYFADGIQDEILTRLSNIADLKVISRTSTLQYQSGPANLREIAKQLGVAMILEGSVQKVADQVRVNVQFINAQTDSHLWADTYDRKLTDIFGVESEIAKRIAESLRATLTSGPCSLTLSLRSLGRDFLRRTRRFTSSVRTKRPLAVMQLKEHWKMRRGLRRTRLRHCSLWVITNIGCYAITSSPELRLVASVRCCPVAARSHMPSEELPDERDTGMKALPTGKQPSPWIRGTWIYWPTPPGLTPCFGNSQPH